MAATVSAYITQAELEAMYTPERVRDLCSSAASPSAADPAVVLLVIEAASGYLEEQALRAGAALPLPASVITPVVKRRLGAIAMWYAADRRHEFHVEGKNPYESVASTSKKELDSWSTGLVAMVNAASDGTLSAAEDNDDPFAVSSRPRRRR